MPQPNIETYVGVAGLLAFLSSDTFLIDGDAAIAYVETLRQLGVAGLVDIETGDLPEFFVSDAVLSSYQGHQVEGPKNARYFVDNEGTAHYLVQGALTKRPTCGQRLFGGMTGTIQHRQQIGLMGGDSRVRNIIMTIDSPGGESAGLFDLAHDIRDLNERKPVSSYLEDRALSGGYLLASQGGKVFANDSANVGSIGAYSVLSDVTERMQREGVKLHVVRSGSKKAIGHPAMSLSEEDRKYVQSRVAAIHDHFIRYVQSGRQLTKANLKEVSEAGVYTADEAVKLGLVDQIMSYQEAVKAVRDESKPRRLRGMKVMEDTQAGAALTDLHVEDGLPETEVTEDANTQLGGDTQNFLSADETAILQTIRDRKMTSADFNSMIANAEIGVNHIKVVRNNAIKMATTLGQKDTAYINALPYDALVSVTQALRAQAKASGLDGSNGRISAVGTSENTSEPAPVTGGDRDTDREAGRAAVYEQIMSNGLILR